MSPMLTEIPHAVHFLLTSTTFLRTRAHVVQKLEKRPILRDRGEKKRRSIEKFIPTIEVMGAKNYLETGEWSPPTELRGMRGSSGTDIVGLERFFLTQTIRKKLFYDAPVRALRDAGAYLTTIY